MHLKKYGKVTICHFARHLEQLNSYLGCLPGLVHSLTANNAKKQIEPMDEAEQAELLLRTCPIKWQDQYSPTQGNTPQDLQSLLEILEMM